MTSNWRLAVVVVLAGSSVSFAQSCAPVIAQMASRWQSSNQKTALTVVSHQANELRMYSGGRTAVSGAPNYEARLVWNGNWMTTESAGGVRGKGQFSDRINTAIPVSEYQNFSVDPPSMDDLAFYLGSSSIWILDLRWNNWLVIPNPRCENGVIWGFGDPIGNNNAGRLALYTFSFSFVN